MLILTCHEIHSTPELYTCRAVFLPRFLVTNTNRSSSPAVVYTVASTLDKDTAFCCTVGHGLFSPYVILFIHTQSCKFPLRFSEKLIVTLKRQHDTEASDCVPDRCWRRSPLPSVTRADPPSRVTLDFQARRQVSGRRGGHPLITFCPEKGWDRLHSSERCHFNHAHAQRAVCFPKSFWQAVIFFPLT